MFKRQVGKITIQRPSNPRKKLIIEVFDKVGNRYDDSVEIVETARYWQDPYPKVEVILYEKN